MLKIAIKKKIKSMREVFNKTKRKLKFLKV
jgi:hypothetical protein